MRVPPRAGLDLDQPKGGAGGDLQQLERGGRDLHQLAVVEGLVTGRGSAAAIASTNPEALPGPPPGRWGSSTSAAWSRTWSVEGLVIATNPRGLPRGGLDLDQGVDLDQLISRRRPGPSPVRGCRGAGQSRAWSLRAIPGAFPAVGLDLDQRVSRRRPGSPSARGCRGVGHWQGLGRGDRLDQLSAAFTSSSVGSEGDHVNTTLITETAINDKIQTTTTTPKHPCFGLDFRFDGVVGSKSVSKTWVNVSRHPSSNSQFS